MADTFNREELDLLLELVKDKRKEYAELNLFRKEVTEKNLEFLNQIITKLEEALLRI